MSIEVEIYDDESREEDRQINSKQIQINKNNQRGYFRHFKERFLKMDTNRKTNKIIKAVISFKLGRDFSRWHIGRKTDRKIER